jgi:uncharacterized protein (TIGR00159 family)
LNSFLEELRLNLRLADVADVFVVAILLYLVLQWLRKRAARAVAAAVVLLALVYACARVFNMYVTLVVFQTGLTVLLVALVVIFQQDIRRTFEKFSSWRGFHPGRAAENWAGHIGDLIETTSALAKQKIGALMVLEGRQPLAPHIDGGVPVKGKISTPLLISIFHPATPGHDGAVVIDRDKIELLGAYLPLSRNLEHIGKGGTRHAAALGLSEVCDALVIVVSEERGTISLAENGKLHPMESIAALKNRLEAFYLGKDPADPYPGWGRDLRRNFPLTAAALGLAVLLWFQVAYKVEPIQRTFEDVPIEFRNAGKNAASPEPAKTRVTLIGKERAFNNFDPKNLKISIDLGGFKQGEYDIKLEEKFVKLPDGLSVRQFETPVVKVFLYASMKTLELPIEPIFEGNPRNGFVLEADKTEVKPDKIKIRFPDFGPAEPKVLKTHPIVVTDFHQTTTRSIGVQLPKEAEQVSPPQQVLVTVHIKKKDTSKMPD